MYTIICDNCKLDIGQDQEYSCWGDEGMAEDNANECDWLKHENNHYCPDCYFYDDNDELVIDKVRTKAEVILNDLI